MPVDTVKIFLASSAELAEHRKELSVFINNENKELIPNEVFFELIKWEEDFINSISGTRLQDEYNKVIPACDIFIMLYQSKVGKYTREEFEVAHKSFETNSKPRIFTYYNNIAILPDTWKKEDRDSFYSFQERLSRLEHFKSVYKNIEELKLDIKGQLHKIVKDRLSASSVFQPAKEWLVEHQKKQEERFVSHIRGIEQINTERGGSSYIELLLKREEETKQNNPAKGSGFDESKANETETIEGILSEFVYKSKARKWLITSEGGAGKSTSLLKLAYDASTNALSDTDSPIPVYVKLNFFDTKERGYEELCNIICTELNVGINDFNKWLLSGIRPFLFLLDGFNEVNEDYHQSCKNALAQLLEHKSHYYVITTRPGEWTGFLNSIAGLQRIEILPLSNKQIKSYLSALGTVQLYAQLDDHLKKLLRNPFMLWALVESCKDLQKYELPNNIGQLYKNFIDRFIFKIRDSKLITRYNYLKVKKVVLGKLAFLMTEKSTTRIKHDQELENKLIEWLEAEEEKHKRRERIMPEDWTVLDFLNEIIKHGVLHSLGDSFEFMHQSVQEYFTAIAIENLPVGEQLKLVPRFRNRQLNLDQSSSYEDIELPDRGKFKVPILMLAGILQDANEFLIAFTAHNMLMSAECVSTATHIDESTREKLIKVWHELLNRKSEILKCIGCYCFSYSKLMKQEVISSLIDLVKNKNNGEVIRKTAAKAIGNIDNHSTLEQLIDLAMQDDEEYSYYSWGKILKSINSPFVVHQLFNCFRDKSKTRAYRKKAIMILKELGTEKICNAFSDIPDDKIPVIVRESIRVKFKYEHENFYPHLLKTLNARKVIRNLVNLYVRDNKNRDYYRKIESLVYSFEEKTIRTELEIIDRLFNSQDKKTQAVRTLISRYEPKHFGIPHASELVKRIKEGRDKAQKEQDMFYVSHKTLNFEELKEKLESNNSNERIAVIKLIGESKGNTAQKCLLDRFQKERLYWVIIKSLANSNDKEEIFAYFKKNIHSPDYYYFLDLEIPFFNVDGDLQRKLHDLLQGYNMIDLKDQIIITRLDSDHCYFEILNRRVYFEIKRINDDLFKLYDLNIKLRIIELAEILDIRTVPDLLKYTGEEQHPAIRKATLTTIARHKDFNLASFINELLDNEFDADIIEHLIGLLKASHSELAITPLLKILKAVKANRIDFDLRKRFVSFGDILYGRSGPDSWVEKISDALKSLNSDVKVWYSLEELFNNDNNLDRLILLRALPEFALGKEAFKNFLLNALNDGSPEIRQEAVRLLYKWDITTAVQILPRIALIDNSEDVRRAAVYALRFSDSPVLDYFLENLRRNNQVPMIEYTIAALADLMDETASEPLEGFFGETEDPNLKILAAEAINKIGNYTDSTFLIQGLLPLTDKHNEDDVIKKAANCLIKVPGGDEELYKPIEDAFSNNNYKGVVGVIGEDEVFNPDDVNLFWWRGVAYFKSKEFEKALRDFTKTIEMSPNFDTVYYFRSTVFYELKKIEEALADAEKAVRLDPKNIEYKDYLASLYFEADKFSGCIEVCKTVLKSDPDHLSAYFNLGIAYLANNKLELGLKYYDEAIKQYHKIEMANKAAELDRAINALKELHKKREELQAVLDKVLGTLGALLRSSHFSGRDN